MLCIPKNIKLPVALQINESDWSKIQMIALQTDEHIQNLKYMYTLGLLLTRKLAGLELAFSMFAAFSWSTEDEFSGRQTEDGVQKRSYVH